MIVTSFITKQFMDIQQAGGMSGYVSMGPFLNFQDCNASRCRVEVRGEIGHNTSQVITHLTVLRNQVPIHPAGASGLSAPRSKTPDAIEPFFLEVTDDIPLALRGTLIRYEVAWWTLAGTAFIGRRPADFLMNTPLSISLTGLADVAAV